MALMDHAFHVTIMHCYFLSCSHFPECSMSKHFSKSFHSLFFLARAFLLTSTFYVSGVLNGDRLFAEECWVWFGTYSQGNTGSEGIYGATIHLESGAITKPILAAKAVNPSFLALHPTRPLLYAVSEIADRDGMPTGGITAFSIDTATGMLVRINDQPSGGGGPCYVSVDPSGKCILCANYGGGSSMCLGIANNGSLEPVTPGGFIQHDGSSVDDSRQKEPHAHCAIASPDSRYALVPDLGLDKVLVHKLDPAKAAIQKYSFGKVAPGSGPRHIMFSPDGGRCYVINEMRLTVTGFDYNASTGDLREFQTLSTLPAGEPIEGKGYSTAEVVVHPSGKFLYGSNRGHDTIAMYSIDPRSGKLSFLGVEPIQGKVPRNFAIDPTGRFLLAAGQGSASVTVFRIDPVTGKLAFTGHTASVPAPVCVRFLKKL